MTTVHVSACIVGGGPAGMMLGLLLAKRGAQVLVLEGHETFDREFRGEVLQPSTAHLLDELGLLEYVLAQPHSLLETGKVRFNGRDAGELAFKRIAPEYPYAIWMPQPIFLAALRRKAEPFPSFQCWMGAKVTKLIQEDGCTVGVSGLRHGREHFDVRADVVIGADGRYSAIAKMGGFRTEYEHHDFDLIWFSLEQPPGWLLIGDAAHTMSPAGAIGVNVAIATAVVAAQELYPRLGRGPISRHDLQRVQRLREADVRVLHRLQLGAQRVLVKQNNRGGIARHLLPLLLPLMLKSPLLPRIQRRIFFGVPLPPLDPAFSFAD